MKFTRLRLHNFKCYEQLDVELGEGATVVHGVNGSGKSSLLEACFFALYGADSLPSNKQLEDIVTKGAGESEIELWFEHSEYQYQLERTIRITDSQVIHEATLKTPNQIVDGVTGVESRIEDVLRMDADAFLNCAYVRQGDITRLLTASPQERQRMIDDLLQLGKIETYRERMDQARLGVDRVRRDRNSKLEDVREEIAVLEEENLEEQIESITAKLDSLTNELEKLENEIDETREKLDAVTEELSKFDERKEELEEVQEEILKHQEKVVGTKEQLGDIRETLEKNQRKRQELLETAESAADDAGLDIQIDDEELDEIKSVLNEEIESVEETIDEIDDEINELQDQAQDAAASSQRLIDQAENLEERAEEYSERADKLEREAKTEEEEIAEQEAELENKKEKIAEKRSEFEAEDIPEDIEVGDADTYRDRIERRLKNLRQDKQEVESEFEAINRQIEHAENLLEKGKCPECGQEIEGAPEVDSLEEDREQANELQSDLAEVTEKIEKSETELSRARELVKIENEISRLENEYSSLEDTIERQRSSIEDKRESAKEARESAEETQYEAEERREEATEKESERDAYIEQLEEARDRKSEYEERLDRLEGLQSILQDIDRVTEQINNNRKRESDIESLVDQQESTLEQLQEDKEELEQSLDEDHIAELENRQSTLETTLEDLEDREERLQGEVNDLREKRGEVRSDINRLEELREREEVLEAKVNSLSSVVKECAETHEMYAALRSELRERNVHQLEQLLNDIFNLIYQNDSYSRIELSSEYELTVFEKSGESLDPDELSGGEKALFNLSLRCAIYQLLAEGIGGESQLPPLILDEPTVHLDSEHVNRIGDLVNRMRQLGVDQTIVVSHEAEIVDSADERIEVIQNSSTNRSRVNVESTDLLAGLTE